jgi:hypothetical protein
LPLSDTFSLVLTDLERKKTTDKKSRHFKINVEREIIMKKDLIFAPIMLVIGIVLFLLKATGMTAHIALSVIGVLVLVAYAVLAKKEWKIPALEVIMRVFYGVALISGIVIMNVHGVAALSIVHKASAALFALLLVFLFVHKLVSKK